MPEFVGFLIYLSALSFIYTQCSLIEWGQAPIKNTYINRYGVPEASAHHGKA